MPRQLECDSILDHLEAYVDGDLEALESRRVEAHLARCPACEEERQLASDIRDELRALPELDAPRVVLQGVFHQVGTERFQPRPAAARPPVARPPVARPPVARPPVARPAWAALAAAVFAALVIGGGLFFSQTTETPRAPVIAETPTTPTVHPEDVARATEEARLAFAHIARVSQKAGFKLREDLGEHLVEPSTESLLRILSPASAPTRPRDVDTTTESDRS